MKKHICVSGLHKFYGLKAEAVKGIDIEVPEGAVYAFLGRNGAGKTTTINTLLGMIDRNAGDVSVLGYDPAVSPLPIRKKTGYVPERQQMYDWMSIGEAVRFSKAFYDGWDDGLAEKLLKRFRLEPGRKLKALSRGMYAQVVLLLALCQKPDLLILDDPTSGLDSIMRREFHEEIIGVLSQRGCTVFFSTHIINEVEPIADHVGILNERKMLYSGTLEALKRTHKKIRLRYDDTPSGNISMPQILKQEHNGRELVLTVRGFCEKTESRIRECGAKTVEVTDMSLEDIFVALAGIQVQ